MIITGTLVLLFVAFQLWGTDVQEASAQGDLSTELTEQFAVAEEFQELIATGSWESDQVPTGDEAALLSLLNPARGDAVARIEMPSIGVDKIIVNGVAVEDLRRGPGYYTETSPIGTAGNTAIAGHRTTYGAPFSRVDELAPGDEITVTSAQGQFTYRVIEPEVAYADFLGETLDVLDGSIIVRPTATWVLNDFGDNRLTLTACHPKLSSRERIIVAAELVEEPAEVIEIPAQVDETPAIEDSPAEETEEPVLDLDEGLGGEREAIAPATAWMGGAVVLWWLSGFIGRRLGRGRFQRVAVRLVGLVPVAVCVWLSFELIDRALPAA